MSIPAAKRRRVDITVAQKHQLCQYRREHPKSTQAQIVRHFSEEWGVVIGRSTVSDILKESGKWLAVSKDASDVLRNRTPRHGHLERALFAWFVGARDRSQYVSDEALINKAKEIGRELAVADFQYSRGWLHGFKLRHGIARSKGRAEAESKAVRPDREQPTDVLLQCVPKREPAECAEEPDTCPLEEDTKSEIVFAPRSNGDASDVQNSSDFISTASRREVRDAFLRGETTKYDPSLRENISTKTDREKDKERQSHLPHHGSTDRPPKSGPKEIIAEGFVGFVNLPNQVYRKAVKRGFEFTLMVVGESGLGKSTLINSMFLTDLYNNEYPGPSHRTKKTIQVESTQVVLKEGGVQLKLTVVDTPGFGDAVDNSNCWQPIIDHIEARYEDYLNAESRVHRTIEPDLRVHCCLYFISPNGHGLKPLDIEFMKRLHDKVNIIPLIAKADTMTPQECRDFKKTVLNEIAQHKIKIYEFPDPEDDDEAKLQKKLKDRVPFAIIGSNTVVDSGGRKVRGRVYPWGTVEVENLEHNDFIALRNMLVRTHMQDLKDVTNNVHYENYRYNKLASVTKDDKSKSSSKSPLLQLEEERKEHDAKMKKMEAEMEQVFEMKVKEKRNKIKESEADLEKRAEQMRKAQEQQEKELKERIAAFEKEQKLWEEQQRILQEQMKTLDKEKTKRKGIF